MANQPAPGITLKEALQFGAPQIYDLLRKLYPNLGHIAVIVTNEAEECHCVSNAPLMITARMHLVALAGCLDPSCPGDHFTTAHVVPVDEPSRPM